MERTEITPRPPQARIGRTWLNQRKINDLNDRILIKTNNALEDARKALRDAQKQVDDGQAELEKQEKSFGETLASGLFGAFTGNADQLAASLQDGIVDTYNQLSELGNILDQISAEVDYAMAEAGADVRDAFSNAASSIVSMVFLIFKASEESTVRSTPFCSIPPLVISILLDALSFARTRASKAC